LRGKFSEAFSDTLTALRILDIELNPTPTRRQVDTLFEQVKNEILAVGFEAILAIPRTVNAKIELAVVLLNDAGEYESPLWVANLELTYFQALTPIGVHHAMLLRMLLV
jgi:hypothetical protein